MRSEPSLTTNRKGLQSTTQVPFGSSLLVRLSSNSHLGISLKRNSPDQSRKPAGKPFGRHGPRAPLTLCLITSGHCGNQGTDAGWRQVADWPPGPSAATPAPSIAAPSPRRPDAAREHHARAGQRNTALLKNIMAQTIKNGKCNKLKHKPEDSGNVKVLTIRTLAVNRIH